jgi:hypothetical protein
MNTKTMTPVPDEVLDRIQVPVRCPTTMSGDLTGCGSSNVTGPDEEGIYDCLDCGLWFHDSEAESTKREELSHG